jgi:aminoglycoside phosphotransferase family enzyme
VGLGNCTGLIEDVLRESAGEIPFYYTQRQVEAMALCSFILKLPPEERKDLERLEKLFDERQMTGAIRLLFGDLPEDVAFEARSK